MAASAWLRAASEWSGPVLLGVAGGAALNALVAALLLLSARHQSLCAPAAFDAREVGNGAPSPVYVGARVEAEGNATERISRLKDGDRMLLSLAVANMQLEGLIRQVDATTREETKRLDELLALAQREVEQASLPQDSVQLVAPPALPALLHIARMRNQTQRLAAAEHASSKKDSLRALVRKARRAQEQGRQKPEPTDQSRRCMQLLGQARQLQHRHSAVRQRAAQLRLQHVLALSQAEMARWLRVEGDASLIRSVDSPRSLATAARAVNHELGRGDVDAKMKSKFKSFLGLKFLASHLSSDAPAARLAQELQDLVSGTQDAESAEAEALWELQSVQDELSSTCRLHLPGGNWSAVHNDQLHAHTAITAAASDKWCVDWDLGDPGHRHRASLALPRHMWEVEHPPSPHLLSFLVLAEHSSGPPAASELSRLVAWALRCTSGAPPPPGAEAPLQAEFLILAQGGVMGANMAARCVAEELANQEAGISARVVVLPRPSTLSTMQAFATLARLAHGSLLVLLRSEDAPREGQEGACRLIPLLWSTFQTVPRLALLGHRAGPVQVQSSGVRDEAILASPFWHGAVGGKAEPDGGVPFEFVSHVLGTTPLLLRASALRSIGGMDESFMTGPWASALALWLLSTRLWLAGFQVGLAGKGQALTRLAPRTEPQTGGVLQPDSMAQPWASQAQIKDLLEHYSSVVQAVKAAR